MSASVSTALTEAHQKVDLAVLLMPEAAFLAMGCLVLLAPLISCQDQGRSTARVLQQGWYQLAVASTYEVCGAVVGARDLTQQLVREWSAFEV